VGEFTAGFAESFTTTTFLGPVVERFS